MAEQLPTPFNTMYPTTTTQIPTPFNTLPSMDTTFNYYQNPFTQQQTNTFMNKQKKKQAKHSGHNINSFVNHKKVATDFITNYFNFQNTNVQGLIDNNLLKEYTVLKYNEIEYQHNELISLLCQFQAHNFQVTKFDFITSGSRRIDINVLGLINSSIHFSQSFIICYENDIWYLKNSIFLIQS